MQSRHGVVPSHLPPSSLLSRPSSDGRAQSPPAFMGLLWLWASEIVGLLPHCPGPLAGPACSCIFHWVVDSASPGLGAPELRSLVWKGFALGSQAEWGICGATALGPGSVQHWVEKVPGSGCAGSHGVSSLARPPFRRPRHISYIFRGAQGRQPQGSSAGAGRALWRLRAGKSGCRVFPPSGLWR